MHAFVRRSQDLIQFAEDNKLFIYELKDRFCRFNKWETQDRQWDRKLNRYTPVPILGTKEDAGLLIKSKLTEL